MKKKPPMQGKQKGIAVITLVIFVVVLLSLLMAMVAMSRATSQSTTEQSAKLVASAVIDQANMLKVGFDLKATQGVQLDAITFDATADTGLFDPKTGTAVRQTPPGDALSDPTSRWLYAKGDSAGGSSTGIKLLDGEGYSNVLVLPNVKDSTCKQLNAMLRNFSVNGEIPNSQSSMPSASGTPDDVGGTFDISGTDYDFVLYADGTSLPSGIGGLRGFDGSSGCFSASPVVVDKNFFVTVVKRQAGP